MKWRRWRIADGRGDFMPLLFGIVILLLSGPAFVMVVFLPETNPGLMGPPVAVILALGIVIGLAFLILGVQLCTTPGSLTYRIVHGRLFRR